MMAPASTKNGIRADGADADAGELDGADLRLLDRLLLAAELHRGVHLQRQPAARRLTQFLVEVVDGDDRRIAGRMHVGGLERCRRGGGARRHGAACGQRAERQGGSAYNISSVHRFLPGRRATPRPVQYLSARDPSARSASHHGGAEPSLS
jgi:hypothetical protein